jgi:acyl-ACP thioesterase
MNLNHTNPFAGKELTFFLPYKVTSADTDMQARLRLGSLINFLIQGAISSADSLGFSFEELRNRKLFWVLSRLTVEIYKPLNWYQTGEVETWPKDLDKILYLRDYVVRDQENQIIAKATSGWLAIDVDTKRPKTIEGIHAALFNQLREKHGLNQTPEKLLPVKEGKTFEVKTGYFDIDLNKHVTSTRYIDWMMDTFSIEFNENNYPKKLSINFLKETMPSETIPITRSSLDNKTFNFEGFNKTSNTFAFRGCIEF